MLYFANASTLPIRDAIASGELGAIVTPVRKNTHSPLWTWCADNGCYGKGYPGDAGYLAWLESMEAYAAMCRFAVAPDVVADAQATLERSPPFFEPIRKRGFKPAFVGQDGLEKLAVPWDDFDAFFIGGSTAWKLGEAARDLALEARRRGKWVHMGRVNSLIRLRYAAYIGCDSVDGTYLTFGPDKNLRRLLSWLREINGQMSFDSLTEMSNATS